MSEIRIKERTFLLGIALISFVIFYLILVDRCDYESAGRQSSERQRVSHKFSAVKGPLAFTVYAVTPTYARPVQKAELTRYYYRQT